MASWIVFLLVGRLLIYLWQKLYLPKFLTRIKFIVELQGCDLCSGVYVFALLAGFLQMDILTDIGFIHVPIISEVITGSVVSFISHVFIIGWKAKFETIII